MTDRKTWALAVSCGVSRMTDADFAAMAANGIHEIELSSANVPNFTEIDYLHTSRALSEKARAHGVAISSIHLPFAPFSSLDPTVRDAAVRKELIETQSALLHAAADAGVTYAIIHPSGEPYREEERAERLSIALDTIAALTDVAGSVGMTLALENLPRTCLCRTSDEMRFFLDRIPALRVVFDTNHSLTESNIDYIRAVGEKIVTLHVSDYDLIDERHWLPGQGKNDWNALLTALETIGYTGRFLYETEQEYAVYRDNYRMLMGI